MLEGIVLFVIMGVLGGLAHVLLWAEGWEDLKTYDAVRDIILGAIAGWVYFFAYQGWSLPDGVVAFVCGYCASDFFEALAEKVKWPWQAEELSEVEE